MSFAKRQLYRLKDAKQSFFQQITTDRSKSENLSQSLTDKEWSLAKSIDEKPFFLLHGPPGNLQPFPSFGQALKVSRNGKNISDRPTYR